LLIGSVARDKTATTKNANYRTDKQSRQLNTLLKDDNTTLIFVKGAPGIGKSYTIRQLQKNNNLIVRTGQNEIEAWLNDKSDQPKILLLDEANMSKPGTWNFLKGLSRDGREVYYQGKVYPLDGRHKIIITGNSEIEPNRYYHAFFQQYGETIYYKAQSELFLKEIILKPILVTGNQYCELTVNMLIYAYNLIHQYNPFLTVSIRDLQSLACRFLCLLASEKSVKVALGRACVGEFAGAIFDRNKRQNFIKDIASYLKIDVDILTASGADRKGKQKTQANETHLINISPLLQTTPEKSYILNALQQDLLMRKQGVFSKRCVLLEGDTGIGKTTLIEAFLKGQGFSQDATDPINKYYKIDLGSDTLSYEKITKILEAASENGSVVILNEFNLMDDRLAKQLNQYLDPDNPGHAKFRVFASQNPGLSRFAARKALSRAMRNRVHFIYMDSYSKKEVQAFACAKDLPRPDLFAEAAEKANINVFTALKTIQVKV